MSASFLLFAPPPWTRKPPCVFQKSDCANTWALKAGAWQREAEKQTQPVSAFLTLKNNREGREMVRHREDEGRFVSPWHGTSRTSPEVADCCEPVGWWWWWSDRGEKVVLQACPLYNPSSFFNIQTTIPQSHIHTPKIWGLVEEINYWARAGGRKNSEWNCSDVDELKQLITFQKCALKDHRQIFAFYWSYY